jgi:integrase
MTFLLEHRSDVAASASPYRVVEQDAGEIAWANRFLDIQRVRGLNELSLRAYGHQLLHFIRWWAQQPGVDAMRLAPHSFTESTLIDYVRTQREALPKLAPETINSRSWMLRRLFRFYFQVEMPHGPYRLQRVWRTPPGGWHRRSSAGAADLRLKVPPRVIEPLSVEQVERFWSSFRTARDIAIVGLLLLNGLRSCEVLSLELEDLLLSEAQMRVRGKGAKVRMLPLPRANRAATGRERRPLRISARSLLEKRPDCPRRLPDPLIVLDQREPDMPFPHRSETDAGRYRDQRLLQQQFGKLQ